MRAGECNECTWHDVDPESGYCWCRLEQDEYHEEHNGCPQLVTIQDAKAAMKERKYEYD